MQYARKGMMFVYTKSGANFRREKFGEAVEKGDPVNLDAGNNQCVPESWVNRHVIEIPIDKIHKV